MKRRESLLCDGLVFVVSAFQGLARMNHSLCPKAMGAKNGPRGALARLR